MTLELNELIDMIRDYEFDQECIMDNSDYDSRAYNDANIRWHAANELFCRIYNRKVVHND